MWYLVIFIEWINGKNKSTNFNISQSVISVTQSCLTPCNPMDCSTPGLPVHYQLPEFTQTHVHWLGDAIQPAPPLLSASPPAFNLSQHQGLSNESALHIRWPKFQVQHQFFQWIFRTDFFRMDWLDLLAVQGDLLQHHSSKESILWHSAFFTSNSHIRTWLLEKSWLWLDRTLLTK